MGRRFKSKKKHRLLKLIIIFAIIYFAFSKTIKWLVKNDNFDNQKLIDYLLSSGTSGLTSEKKSNLLGNINLSSPSYLLKNSTNSLVDISEAAYLEAEEENVDLTIPNTEDPNKTIVKEPILYIYNTHQKEHYQNNNSLEYNITPTVLFASFMLKEKLNNLGINTIVEENDIAEILRTNNWQYKYSYDASRILMENAKESNSTLRYYIDLHRDSSKREKTITEIDGKIYAKVLFVVGLEHKNYESNLNLTVKLNNLIKEKYSSLSRGIYKKSGEGVNGIYNQDFDENTILLELGGQYNTIEEVNNTINIIAPIIANLIKEGKNGN